MTFKNLGEGRLSPSSSYHRTPMGVREIYFTIIPETTSKLIYKQKKCGFRPFFCRRIRIRAMTRELAVAT